MALSRPTRFTPDKSSGEYKAINASNIISSTIIDNMLSDLTVFKMSNSASFISTPFTFVCNGSSYISGIQIKIYSTNNNLLWDSNKILSRGNLYPVNYLGEENIIKAYIPNMPDKIKTGVGANYVWSVTVYWKEKTASGEVEKSITSAESYFESRQNIILSEFIIDGSAKGVNNSYYIDGLEHSFEARYLPINTEIPIKHFSWELYDANGNLIKETGNINSAEVKFNYDGFMSLDYTLRLKIVNISGVSLTKDIILMSNKNIGYISKQVLKVENISEEACIRVSWDKEKIKETLLTTSGETLDGFEIYKRKRGELYEKYVCFRTKDAYEIYDYDVANNSEYTYYLYPLSLVGGKYKVVGVVGYNNGNPDVELYCKASFFGNILLVLRQNPTQDKGVCRVFKFYRWYLNLESTNYKNNSNIVLNSNYTRFPKVQRGKQNYLTVSLQNLVGYMDCSTNEIIDTQEMLDDIRYMTNSNYDMILKTNKGAILKVAPISNVEFDINETLSKSMTSMTLDLAEVGETKDISIVNKENNTRWMFTKDGKQPVGTLSVNLAGYVVEDGTILAPSNPVIE